ncbi:hypothetical protein SASPL_102625 [Salvia splendens]|uniref:F-box domain-containing protein n=2 Tax=Salvia splendens TaxID=180675 RepID=A0A8X9AEB9_SALSN|nr:F-box/kelch-repeat protein SKIP4-like isoform X1 [Salvia splendens]XP_042001202.1 F-box/kelch-repeat protein SKIP4-like isoform X1 [Salvia splendens]XP_042001209.1 F-box/kelch-repeat protein SKIP4-like isoform X1 [Salvia splendens]XP_042001216.1 F-box/kelch-repeat protein SKIP4-like isoform X1 [Salvia splendens]KAG6437699.1 hypothetical protein SASPL_102625 [Salvia splendens]
MDCVESFTNVDCSKMETDSLLKSLDQSLIPGIPDDVALSCLARVPRKYHPVLTCVSKSWRYLVGSEEWFWYRLNHHLEETWIYSLCRDKSEQLCMYALDPNQFRRGWRQIHGPPGSFLRRKGVGFEVLGKKIYLFGGCGWIEDATDEVYSYDASTNTWARGAPLPTARCFFAHETLDGKIYAIGGLGSESSDQHSWDIYDSQTSSWSSHVDINVIPDIEDSAVMDGKIYVRAHISASSSQLNAAVYDPSSWTWQQADSDVACWCGPIVVVDGILYILDQNSGVRLMMWQKDTRVWIGLRRFSEHLVHTPCRLVAVGKKMFVVGRGLNTVMFDVESASCVDGVLVSSSVLKLDCVDEVISCKSLAI